MGTLTPRTVTKYENNLMLSHDGLPLSTVAGKRLDWYIKRNLADEVTDYPDKRHPRVIRLRFKHDSDRNARASDTVIVENRCVVCGATSDLTKHHVIPYRIKRLYAARDKEFTRHQCVLLCGPHHAAAEKAAALVGDPCQSSQIWATNVIRWVSLLAGRLQRLRIRYWMWRRGGVTGINQRFTDVFMRLEPKYLPEGWLQP
jgi:hypothetical protein